MADRILRRTMAAMRDSGLSAEQIRNRIPVKPMADGTAALVAAYNRKLTGPIVSIRP